LEKPLWEQQSFPEKLFRLSALVCIVGWGLSAIYIVSHVSSMEDASVRARDLASYFFTAIWIFVFFYAQYRVVPRFIHRDLDRRVGLWHALGSLALLIVGALHAVLPQTKSDVPSGLLFWITLLGEGAFIGNVIWSYVGGEAKVPLLPVVPDAKTAPERVPDDSAKNMGWPKSPVKLFGIGAAFFAAGGIVSLVLNLPSYPIPVPVFGQLHFVPYGCLWLTAAVPFAIFAMLYKYLMDAHKIAFEESLNRIHFVVTIIAVFDLVRVFMAWEQALVSKMAALYFGPEIEWLAVLFGLSAVAFAINAYRSYRRTAIRT
jgi:heme/copper-type cytochrome/quinol oxidase subunit 1